MSDGLMAPLVVLIITFGAVALVFRLARGHWSVPLAGRLATAAMFVFTGVSHFIFRGPMAEMVPPVFPIPDFWVSFTGVAEVSGGLGLLIPRTRRLAAWSLALLLVAIFPANVYAALEQVGMGGHRQGPSYLWFRAPLQLFLLAWIVYFGILDGGSSRGGDRSDG
jgi:uncharacterized membrane protein